MRMLSFSVLLLISLMYITCVPEPEIVLDETPYNLNYGALPEPEISTDNPLTVQKVTLGRMLFYETMLSKDGEMSCASCHVQSNGFSDTTRFSIGVEGLPGKRQAMGIFNMAWNTNEFFWDGRAHLLRDQSLKPIEDPLEMNEQLDNVIVKLSADQKYTDQFIRAFGTEEITTEKMALAMEAFMNTIVSYDSKYDRYLAGTATMTESEERGMNLFFTEYNPFFPEQSGADCAHCHGGENFENDQYMNNGLDTNAEMVDEGRMKVSMNIADRGKFKVTSLRNIERTPPYMHDGRFNTLEEVINHYNEGLKMSSSLDPALQATMEKGLLLSEQDKIDLINFLKTLTDYTMVNNAEYSSPF